MLMVKTQAKSLPHVSIGGAVLWMSLIWPSMSAAQNKSDHAKGSNPHAQHQENQPAGGQDASGQMPGMKMQGMSGQKQESAWWFDKYSRGQKPDMAGWTCLTPKVTRAV